MNIENIKPAKGKILGEAVISDYVSPGGIHVVNTMKKKKIKKIRVLAVGGSFDDEKGRPQKYRALPGDVVFFSNRAGRTITLERKQHLILDNEDVHTKEVVTAYENRPK